MNDRDVQRILDEGHAIAAVILARGGWQAANKVEIVERFPATETDTALWRIDMFMENEADIYYSLYTKAESIVGISVRRHKQHS